MTLSALLKRLEIPAVPHGFRSSFRDWVAEETDHPREVAEAALAHLVRNPVEAAYARSDLFERRRRLMNDWAGYIERTSPEQPPAAAEPARQGSRRQPSVLTTIHDRTEPCLPDLDRPHGPHRRVRREPDHGRRSGVEPDDEHEKVPESRRGSERRRGDGGRTIGERRTLAHDPVGSHEPAYPMSDIGLAGGSAPSTPGRTERRDAAPVTKPPSTQSSPDRSATGAPAHGRTPPSTRWRGSSACAEHDRQLGGASPLSSLMAAKD